MIIKIGCMLLLLSIQLLEGTSKITMINKSPVAKSVKKSPIMCIAIPKCGTHLLIKCLSLLGDASVHLDYEEWKRQERVIKKIRHLNRYSPPNHYKGRLHVGFFGSMPSGLADEIELPNRRLFYRHFPYTSRYDAFLDKKGAIKFLMVRDPRAMVVSFAHMIHKGYQAEQIAKIESIILDLIDGRQQCYVSWAVEIQEAYPPLWEVGVVKYYESFLQFQDTKNCKLIRFEDLVGERGGGTLVLQIKEICDIATHAGISLDLAKAAELSQTLFGGSGTFREGKIDGWKKHFTSKIKEAFKKTPGACKLLIDLGYEKDDSW